jgi:hypothetical protein
MSEAGEPSVRIESMAEGEKGMDEREDLLEFGARVRRERDERIAELPAKLAKEPLEMSPGMKELIDSQEEYQREMRARLRRLLGL